MLVNSKAATFCRVPSHHGWCQASLELWACPLWRRGIWSMFARKCGTPPPPSPPVHVVEPQWVDGGSCVQGGVAGPVQGSEEGTLGLTTQAVAQLVAVHPTSSEK